MWYLSGVVSVGEAVQGGWTPLHSAVSAQKEDVVRMLARNGANVSARNRNGCIPLHYHRGNAEIVHILTESDAGRACVDAQVRVSVSSAAVVWCHCRQRPLPLPLLGKLSVLTSRGLLPAAGSPRHDAADAGCGVGTGRRGTGAPRGRGERVPPGQGRKLCTALGVRARAGGLR